MARTFIDQPTQVFHSDTYNDSFATGANLVSNAGSLEDDLNALRTQVKAALYGSSAATGHWYDSVTGVANLSPARGINNINSALTNVEQQRFLFDVQQLGFLQVPSGSNFVSLSVSGSTAPSGLAAVGLGATTGSFTGSLAATLAGAAGTSFSLNLISGTSAILPRNMVRVRDAYTHDTILDPTHGNHEVIGLLQIDSTATDGTAFSDTAGGRSQISFVVEYPSGTLVAAATTAIGGKIINYQYRTRVSYLNLPEDAYADTVFVDVAPYVGPLGGAALFTDVTLQNALNNQGTNVASSSINTTINLAGGGGWTFADGSNTVLWQLLEAQSRLTVGATTYNVTSTNVNYLAGLHIATGSAEMDIGVVAGTLATKVGQNLILSGGQKLEFSDNYGPTSTFTGGMLPLANSVGDWNTFTTDFGTSTSILGAFNFLSSSLSGSFNQKRVRASAGVNVAVTAATNVTYPTNLDAPLVSYVGRDFVNDLNIYLNGTLLLGGYNALNANDVYPGTSAATGDLKFVFNLRSGSILSMERF